MAPVVYKPKQQLIPVKRDICMAIVPAVGEMAIVSQKCICRQILLDVTSEQNLCCGRSWQKLPFDIGDIESSLSKNLLREFSDPGFVLQAGCC